MPTMDKENEIKEIIISNSNQENEASVFASVMVDKVNATLTMNVDGTPNMVYIPGVEDEENAGRRGWSKHDDEQIVHFVNTHGSKRWSRIKLLLPHKTAKQCRTRWVNCLDPSINRRAWSREETLIIFDAQRRLGNKWAEISKLLVGRTDNAVKNHWYATSRRRTRQTAKQVRKEACIDVQPPLLRPADEIPLTQQDVNLLCQMKDEETTTVTVTATVEEEDDDKESGRERSDSADLFLDCVTIMKKDDDDEVITEEATA